MTKAAKADAAPSPPTPLPQQGRGEKAAPLAPVGGEGLGVRGFGTAVTQYVLLCLGSLGMVFLAELERFTVVTLLSLLVGLGGVLARLRSTPILYLLVLTLSQLFYQIMVERFGANPFAEGFRLPWVFRPSDLLLGAGALTFVLSHYRLQTLTRHLWPMDVHDQGREQPRQRRSPHLVSGGEFALVALAVLQCVALAFLGWLAVVQAGPVLGLPLYLGRIVLVGWLLALAAYVLTAGLSYWRRCRMTRDQGLLILQDVVWRDTRQEQRHVNRDAARTRWQRAQRKERP